MNIALANVLLMEEYVKYSWVEVEVQVSGGVTGWFPLLVVIIIIIIIITTTTTLQETIKHDLR